MYHKDVFIEQLVTRKMDIPNVLIRGGIVLGVILIPYLMMYVEILAPFSIFVLLGLLYFGYKLFKLQSIEFEYIVTNGVLDIDIIRGKSRRKRRLSVSAGDFEMFGPVKEGYQRHYAGPSIAGKIDAASTSYTPGRYFAIFNSKDKKRTVLFFEPNEKVLEALTSHIQRTAMLER